MIRKAGIFELQLLAELAVQLWKEHEGIELKAEFADLINRPDAALFLAFDEADQPVGFAQCQLRTDYVEGTRTSPVGYLEGIFVRDTSRKGGYGRKLLAACEDWAREHGCREFACDCELGNEQSLPFYLKSGFEEANRIICLTKTL